MDTPYLRPALLQEKLNAKVRCLTCERRCEVAEGGLGWCRTRQNEGGALYTLITWQRILSLSQPHREEAPLSFLPRQRGPDGWQLELQFQLPLVPELGHLQIAASPWTLPVSSGFHR